MTIMQQADVERQDTAKEGENRDCIERENDMNDNLFISRKRQMCIRNKSKPGPYTTFAQGQRGLDKAWNAKKRGLQAKSLARNLTVPKQC